MDHDIAQEYGFCVYVGIAVPKALHGKGYFNFIKPFDLNQIELN